MNDAEAEKILHLLSVSRYDVAFPYAIYAKLESYDPFGPLAPKIREAMFRIRTHIAQQLEKQSKKLLNAEIAVKLSSYLAILDKSSAHNKLYNLRRSIAPYLSRFDYEHDLTEVDDSVDISANIAVWQAISEEFSLRCFEDNKKVAGFEEFSGFFAALGPNYIGEIIDLANVESTQNLSKKTPSTDQDDNRRRYISEMNDVLGQISIQLWHEYQKQNLIYIGSTTSDTVPTVKKHKSISFNKNTFSNKNVLTSSIDTVVCSRSSDIELVAQRTQIKSKAKDIWNGIYAWDDKLTKKYPLLYPAAKSMTVAVSTGMIGSMAYSGYKLGKAVKKSFNNYKNGADKTKYSNYFRYITAKENFNEAADIGRSAALLAVSSVFTGYLIAEKGLSAATGLAGYVSNNGISSLSAGGFSSANIFEKIQHLDIVSAGKSLVSNTRILASSAIGGLAGLATSINTGIEQRRAEKQLDALLKKYGAVTFPTNEKIRIWRSTNPAQYYSMVMFLNEMKLSSQQKQSIVQLCNLIDQKRTEKQKRGWGAGLGTVLGLGSAGIFGALHNDMAISSDKSASLVSIHGNHAPIQDQQSSTDIDDLPKKTCHRTYYLKSVKQLIRNNENLTVGEKLQRLGWHEGSKNFSHSINNVSAEDVSSERADNHTAYYKKSVKNITTDGYTPTEYGTSYKIDNNGDIIFKGELPDEETASKIEAEAFSKIKHDAMTGQSISQGEHAFLNDYAYSNGMPDDDSDYTMASVDYDQQSDVEVSPVESSRKSNHIDYDDIYYNPSEPTIISEPLAYDPPESVYIDEQSYEVSSIRRIFDDDYSQSSYKPQNNGDIVSLESRRDLTIHDDIYYNPDNDTNRPAQDDMLAYHIRKLQYY